MCSDVSPPPANQQDISDAVLQAIQSLKAMLHLAQPVPTTSGKCKEPALHRIQLAYAIMRNYAYSYNFRKCPRPACITAGLCFKQLQSLPVTAEPVMCLCLQAARSPAAQWPPCPAKRKHTTLQVRVLPTCKLPCSRSATSLWSRCHEQHDCSIVSTWMHADTYTAVLCCPCCRGQCQWSVL